MIWVLGFLACSHGAVLPPALRGLHLVKDTDFQTELGCNRNAMYGATSAFYARRECNDEDTDAEFGPSMFANAECREENEFFVGVIGELDRGVWYDEEEKKNEWTACYCTWWMKRKGSPEIFQVWSMKETGDINEETCANECPSANQAFYDLGSKVLYGESPGTVDMGMSEPWSGEQYTLSVCVGNPWGTECQDSCGDMHNDQDWKPSNEVPLAVWGKWGDVERWTNVQIRDEMVDRSGCNGVKWASKWGAMYANVECNDAEEKGAIYDLLDSNCKVEDEVIYGRDIELDQNWNNWVGCYCNYWRIFYEIDDEGEKTRMLENVWAWDRSINSYDDLGRCGDNCPAADDPNMFLKIGPDHLHFGGSTKFECTDGDCLDESTFKCSDGCGSFGKIMKFDEKKKHGKTNDACECEANCAGFDFFTYRLPKDDGKGVCTCHKGGKIKEGGKKSLVGGL